MSKKYKKWREEDIEFIKNNGPNMPDNTVAMILSKITGYQISTDMVRAQRRKLKIVKNRGRKKNHPTP
jgi:hypothetical protein